MVLRVKNGLWAPILAVGTFVLVSLMLYMSVDSNAKRRQPSYSNKGSISDKTADPAIQRLKQRMQHLQDKARSNTEMLRELTGKVDNVIDAPNKIEEDEQKSNELSEAKEMNREQIPAPIEHAFWSQTCPPEVLMLAHNASSDVQMLNVYDMVPFDNPDGGTWKQGWPVKYDKSEIRHEKKLEVVVVPHSHNDPGWLKTFEGYYEEQTKHILDLMVTHLGEKPEMKFIYAEMSFFELWWSQQNLETKQQVKKFLERGQLEIVTGGWVMTDEANAHYFSTVMELFEGHEFLQNQLGYAPRNHWSIDPFGLSPTLAYILNRANLSNMVIQRVHYSVKKYLAQTKQLEFVWRQLFAGKSSKTDILTHMFPFYSYDAPHSCGPEPMVCCQFDFRRMHAQMNCPWGAPPVPITKENVAERAELLADQYRKKAQLYGFNTILVPLGDDFRYDVNSEWTDQYSNYKQLFEHMNAREDLNIRARFGTLADYFTILHQRLSELERIKEEGKLRHSVAKHQQLPILSGDFFTYADRDDHYWSGYFTSRPFYKHMDRSLQHFLRAADIFFSLANWKGQMPATLKSLYNNLVSARRAMSLFQHHDGVTGTARTSVMTDYGEKMAQALADSKQIIGRSVEFLMGIPSPVDLNEKSLRVDEEHFVNRLPEKFVVEDGSTVLVANPLGQPREELVCLHVPNVKSRVRKSGQPTEIRQQIGPIFYTNMEGKLEHFTDKFELCFLANLPAFGLSRFEVVESEDISHRVSINAFNEAFKSTLFDVKSGGQVEDIVMSNERISARFSTSSGYLKSVRTENGEETVDLSFVRYGTRPRDSMRRDGGDSLSGAYLFLPDGPATELASDQNSVLFVQGPIRQYIYVKGPSEVGIRHLVFLDTKTDFLSLMNTVNLGTENGLDRGDRAKNAHLSNYELAMRLRAPSIKGDNFFTDLNGFQMIRRKRQSKLPLQAHFYPMPGSAFVQDSRVRVTLLGRQALGVASLESGEMQVILDRRLIQDDDRGLAQTIEDNLVTESRFRLYVEHFISERKKEPLIRAMDTDTVGFHSLAAHHASLQLHYAPIILTGQLDHTILSEMPMLFSSLQRPFPCDVHTLAFRTLSEPTVYGDSSEKQSTDAGRNTLPKQEAALVLHRLGFECSIGSAIPSSVCPFAGDLGENWDLKNMFINVPRSIRRGSLTLLQTDAEDKQQEEREPETIKLEPMELATVKIGF